MKGILVTNFAYGTGPYLRTTDLAIAFNDALEKRGRPRLRCLIPWVYGEKQRTVMREEFGGHAAEYQDEIILDPALGKLLGGIFYKKEKYHNSLARWIATCEETEDAMRRHLVGTIRGEMLDGKEVALDGKDIVVELNRSPRCNYGVAPSYSASFGYLSLILERAASHGEAIAVPEDLLRKGVTLARRIEAAQKIFAVAYPSTFTDTPDYRSPYSDKRREVIVPPLISVRSPKNRALLKGKGIFVTITGIPGLERLYRDARSLGLRLYSNDTNAVPDATYASPHALEDDAILLHFARSGWSSVWLSMIYDTALVVPEFDKYDDPEIYFNNEMIEQLGIGIVYREQALADMLADAENVRMRSRRLMQEIHNRWGTYDGNTVAAESFVSDFLGETGNRPLKKVKK